jgi:putative addiction module component (TIGR02574 family)
LTEIQKAELDRRREDLERDPHAGESWEVIQVRLYDHLKRGE